MPPRIPLSPGGPGPGGGVGRAQAAGLFLEGHPVDASVAPRLALSEAPARPLPSPEAMLRDMIGHD